LLRQARKQLAALGAAELGGEAAGLSAEELAEFGLASEMGSDGEADVESVNSRLVELSLLGAEGPFMDSGRHSQFHAPPPATSTPSRPSLATESDSESTSRCTSDGEASDEMMDNDNAWAYGLAGDDAGKPDEHMYFDDC
jgi:hypothetical protein